MYYLLRQYVILYAVSDLNLSSKNLMGILKVH